jgi:hypothetical protein
MKIVYSFAIAALLAGATQAQLMHGTIRDAITKKPIRGATITIIEISKTCTTDSNGCYSTGLVPAGIFNATVSAPNHIISFKKVFIAWPKGRGISEIRFNTSLYDKSTNADTTRGKMSLTYRFPGQADVEIAIKNGIGKTIRKMYDRSRAGGTRTAAWNGRDDDGNVVPAGRYQCKISSGRLVSIRTLEWKGEAVVPPSDVPPAPETSVAPATATEVLPKAEETPSKTVEIPAPQEPGTKTTEEAPQAPKE